MNNKTTKPNKKSTARELKNQPQLTEERVREIAREEIHKWHISHFVLMNTERDITPHGKSEDLKI